MLDAIIRTQHITDDNKQNRFDPLSLPSGVTGSIEVEIDNLASDRIGMRENEDCWSRHQSLDIYGTTDHRFQNFLFQLVFNKPISGLRVYKLSFRSRGSFMCSEVQS